MKETIDKTRELYRKHELSFFLSFFGSLIMGTIHLVLIVIRFDWILINYCIFSYLMALFKIWQWSIDKYHIKPDHFIAGIISISIVIAPMMAAFVLTILYKDAPHYLFDWFIYVYALYGTIKMVMAIKNIAKKETNDRKYILSFLGLIGALFTMQMMEFNLIATFDSNSSNAMYLMQLFSQGFIFLFSLFVIGLFVYKATASRRKENNNAE